MWVWNRHGRQFGYMSEGERGFVAYFWRSGWSHISLGAHVDWAAPNFEIHVPLGFFRIGWRSKPMSPIIIEVEAA